MSDFKIGDTVSLNVGSLALFSGEVVSMIPRNWQPTEKQLIEHFGLDHGDKMYKRLRIATTDNVRYILKCGNRFIITVGKGLVAV